MTAISVRAAHTSPFDRLLVRLGLALVHLGRARATRYERMLRRERALLAAERRRAGYERELLEVIGPRR
ncbi:hypothetical protein [Gryllotalpicola protaetiae]|uniref:Uncharacterized protein n=1 Tax=Gryllotalpicola protaetiae TaxID=2419771 RepID=A0A387BVJ0_9MICO|nr:hypothetical protein [Gryllotalpicola protaetiae]AYG05136.1 hypothetical protein D7I44_17530 [Gryllotalpicola protaetiae]